MTKSQLKRVRALLPALRMQLHGRREVTAESLAKNLRHSKADVTRGFSELNKRGWGIHPTNAQYRSGVCHCCQPTLYRISVPSESEHG